MKTGIVYHRNWIEDEINESFNKNPDVDGKEFPGRMIFCKKNHKVMEPLADDCMSCPYYAGLMQGWGHECAWEDELNDEFVDGDTMDIPWDAREKELLRVSKLIDRGIIQKG